MNATGTSTIVTTCTRDCPSACGVIATVKDGRVVSLTGNPEHPVTGGRTCGKLARYTERVYSADRVLHPLRKTPCGDWQQIPWDVALDEIANRMKVLRETHGPQSILYYQGFGTRTALQLLNQRFFNRFGGVTTLRGTLCGGTGEAAQNLDLGARISHDPADLLNAQTVILWGRNPMATQQPLMPIVKRVQKKGGEVVVIDPVYTATAKTVTRHIQPAPGKDLWLALAVAQSILQQGLVDTEFVAHHAEHYKTFVSLVKKWPKERLIEASGVSADDVLYLAQRLSNSRPAAILLGWGLHRWVYAHEAIRAIDALSAMTGNIGIPGGGVSQGFDEWGPFDTSIVNPEQKPVGRTLLMPRIGDEILSASNPAIEMIFVTAGNPVAMAPDSTRVKGAFERTPFVVVCGQFMDDTGTTADLFLPVTTWLEESDVVAAYGHDVVGPVNPVIAPLGEARSHFDIFSALAHRLDINDFDQGKEKWLNEITQPLQSKGVSLAQIRRGPVRQGLPPVPYGDRIFPTDSTKFQFVQQIESVPDTSPDTEWPLALLSTSPGRHLCSEWLPAEHPPLPVLIVNDTTALANKVADGDTVTVESKKGHIVVKLQVDCSQRSDVAIIQRGGWAKFGHGVNTLTESLVSKIGNGTAYYETRVRIRPLAASSGPSADKATVV